MKKIFLFLLVLFYSINIQATNKHLLRVNFNENNGTFDIFDKKNEVKIITNSRIGFEIAPYIELYDLKENEIETNVPTEYISSNNSICYIENDKTIVCKKEGIGILKVSFLYDKNDYLQIRFSFENLSLKPIRLRKINIIDGDYFPTLNKNNLKLLGGTSGGGRTNVSLCVKKEVFENNFLSFILDSSFKNYSLVLGGLTYEDYRKYISVDKNNVNLYAYDPIGKRVDSHSVYESKDYFYVNSLINNPFEALEKYSDICKKVRNINIPYYTFPTVCMWFITVEHFGGDLKSKNSTFGSVKEMENIAKSGILKYSPVGIRLVPDCYEQDNEQGWWDDAHWYLHGRTERCIVKRHYERPYETTKKWTEAIRKLGGIPITYFQPGVRSEDYAECFPEHMLYNKSRKYVLYNNQTVSDLGSVMGTKGKWSWEHKGRWVPGFGKFLAEAYDYTDSSFVKYMKDKYIQLRKDGLKGIFYDYPSRAFSSRGGLEDRYATATAAYRNVFKLAHENLGPDVFLQESLGTGSDATLEYVASVRTAGDNNILDYATINNTALKWYKNRKLTNYDMDGKALLKKNVRSDFISKNERRSILTISYTITGRLLLTESFRLYDEDIINDLGKILPFHSTPLSARPINAFTEDSSLVFDFKISNKWHQLVLFNNKEQGKIFTVNLSGNTALGALGLNSENKFYIYDFWNNKFIGTLKGNQQFTQNLQPLESRMFSIHEVENVPQWISTNRHIMQGYVDLVQKPKWNASKKSLSGISKVIENEKYIITIALNGFVPKSVSSENSRIKLNIHSDNQLVDVIIESDKTKNIEWQLDFE